ncbi:MAG: hypothetical protein HHJ09_04880 [Glaciimonas sp.]|nr:hypothetical protein [Glaciimonas sp.]
MIKVSQKNTGASIIQSVACLFFANAKTYYQLSYFSATGRRLGRPGEFDLDQRLIFAEHLKWRQNLTTELNNRAKT